MKKILLLSLSLITLISCEKTPTDGCTDPLAINYNRHANIDNNSCDFKADIIFYLDQAAGIYLYNEGVEKLTFEINVNGSVDNNGDPVWDERGTQYNNGGFYTSETPPNCFDNFFTTYSEYWSNNSYTSISWRAIDEAGFVWYENTTILEGSECLPMELSANKLTVYQENN
mgnify:CR=1 FL=1|jgi:hypothetical protein|tara:strand:- start:72 stop:584 length:513 start_codon:yes stop_codon:yes gene_type:complete